ncbi:hypothetical protein H0H92_010777, partial [Tricholoma furcatifolium]
IYALKRYWRSDEGEPDKYPSEGTIYKELDKLHNDQPWRKYLEAAHDIKVNNEVDDTVSFIRHGLTPRQPEAKVIKHGKPREEHEVDAEPLIHLTVPAPSSNPVVAIIGRCHVNVLGKVGEIISHFASLRELLRCLRDFVHVCPTDHKSAHDKLYLQRDISIGNLLILEGTAGETFGRLVDYDHAKKAMRSEKISRHDREDTAFWASQATSTLLAMDPKAQWKVQDKVALEAVACVAHPVFGGYYLFDVIKNDPCLAEKAATSPLSMDDLHWTETVRSKLIAFVPLLTQSLTRKRNGRILSRVFTEGVKERRVTYYRHYLMYSFFMKGTLPFMSAEVIDGESIITPVGYDSAPMFTHQAIHDMESLFWVLVYLCMTRRGPGMDMRRDELRDPNVDLSRAVDQYFDGDSQTLRRRKGGLLKHPELIEEEIIKHFHPYFDGLKPLVRKWWKILNLGYRYRAKEFYNIHAYLIRTINEAVASLPQETNQSDTDRELARRLK